MIAVYCKIIAICDNLISNYAYILIMQILLCIYIYIYIYTNDSA